MILHLSQHSIKNLYPIFAARFFQLDWKDLLSAGSKLELNCHFVWSLFF